MSFGPLGDTLADILTGIGDDTEEAMESLGITDHNSLRAFGQRYAIEVAQGVAEDGEELTFKDLGASLVGGIYIGMEYVRRTLEQEGRLPWESS